MQIRQSYFIPLAVFYSSMSLANNQCLAPVRPLDKSQLAAEGHISVKANHASMTQNRMADFEGDVEITNAEARIQADRASVNKETRTLTAQGDIAFQNEQIRVQSQDITLDIDSNEMHLSDTRYRMLQFQGRGNAETLNLVKEEGITLNEVSFSTCPEGAEDWRIQASSIEVKQGEVWGKARNARFYVQDVPVFYLPYFAFPVTDERQSGLLIPEIDTSDEIGVSYRQPIYWNIAPNFDATITPRVMSQRGVQLINEFRYLNEQHAGSVHVEYMPEDTDTISGDDRYFYRLTHDGQLSDNWNLLVEWNGLSDDNYIVDLGTDFYNRADTHLFKTAALIYNTDTLDIKATIRDFEVIGQASSAYRALPEVRLNYDAWQGEYFNLDLHSELALFDNEDSSQPKATRLHVAPTLSLPLHTAWAEFLAETSILHTSYRQENIENTNLARSVDRTLGQVRLYGSMAFERETSWFGKSATQTLEPKVQYLYTSYENQEQIGFYDTTRLLNDYTGLFRGQEFTGLDRINDHNQVTAGVTTRIMDELNQEKLSFSLAQILFLDNNRVLNGNVDDGNRSVLATELDWSISSRWRSKIEAQLSSKNEQVERSSVSIEYRESDTNSVELNHRYVRNLSGTKINQTGITASWQIADNWQWVGRYYRDLDLHRTTETYTGFQYESCCWAIQLVWDRHLTNRFDALGGQTLNDYDSGIRFNFSFRGMSTSNNRRTLLDEGLYGLQQPFNLGQ